MTEGEFQKIEASDERMYGPKGVLVCGYPPPEHRFFALFMDKAGFGDRPVIFPTNDDTGKTLKELFGLATGSGMGEPADLPRAARAYLDLIAAETGVPVVLASVGSRRDDTVWLGDPGARTAPPAVID